MSSKSLSISHSSLPTEFLLPSHLHVKNFELLPSNFEDLEYFTKLESITVEEKFTFKLFKILNSDNILLIWVLFRIVKAPDWDIRVSLHDHPDVIESFISMLSIINGRICCLSIDSLTFNNPYQESSEYAVIQLSDVLALLEVIFKQMDSSRSPYLELKLKESSVDENCLEVIYDVWRKNGAVQLKKFNITKNENLVDNETVRNLLSQMAIKYYL
jgi:hypothetical protein